MISAVAFITLWHPIIHQLLDESTLLSFLLQYQTLLLFLLGIVILTMLAGMYPAFIIMRFNPADVIRNNTGKYMSRGIQRRALVTVQFAISMILILFTTLLLRQYFFLQSKDAGFAKDYRVVMKMLDDHDVTNYATLKEQLKQLSFVEDVAVSSTVVGLGEGFYGFNVKFSDRTELSDVEWFTLGVDEDYVSTFDITILEGRDFSGSITTDQKGAFLLNRTAADQIGGQVVGENMELTVYTGVRDVRKGKVIGIVEDFHYQSLYESVKPLVIYINKHEYYTNYLNVKLNAEQSIVEQVKALEAVYGEFNPDKVMELLFIEDEIAQTYQRELASSKIMFWFTILSIFIAALGAFGLATYSFRRRTKEIGVRKVLGASPKHITIVLLKEYLLLLAIACVVAWPIIYYLSQEWLSNFAYAIDFGVANYLLGLVLLVVIVLLSNLHQILSSIRLKPVEYLRTE
ncbi:MAG: FtsX-like permease family protein [Bacteroidota bacterium]